MALLVGAPRIQLFIPNQTNTPAAGYGLYSCAANTTTPINTYANTFNAVNMVNPNPNPCILDSNGMTDIVVTAPTKLYLLPPNALSPLNLAAAIWSVDYINYNSPNITDQNGNTILAFVTAPNSVNYLQVTNASTGNSPILGSTGTDTNINLELLPKGTGNIICGGSALSTLLNQNFNITPNGSGIINLNANTNTTGTLQVTGNSSLPIINTFTMPSSDGSNGQPIITNGSKVLSLGNVPQSAIVQPTTAAFAYMSGTQSIPNNTPTIVQFNNALYNNGAYYSVSTFKYTPLVAGYYYVETNLAFTVGAATFTVIPTIAKNGSTILSAADLINTVGSSTLSRKVSGIVRCNGTTDFITVVLSQNAGSSLTLGLTDNVSTNFKAFLAEIG